MMKTEVTAENRPACPPDQHMYTYTTHTTHRYESDVQVRVVPLD